MQRKEVERVLYLCSSKVYTDDVLCGFLRRVFLYSCSSRRFAVSTKAVFLVVLKSYFGSLRVVTTITYLAPALYWKCFYETCFFVVFGFC